MQRHVHPVSGEVIEGIRLVEGAVLREEDVYDSTTGKWEAGPCAGLTLQNTRTIWVRPQNLSGDAKALLVALTYYKGELFATIGKRDSQYWLIPTADFDWDPRVGLKSIRHPELLRELVDFGYLSQPQRDIWTLTPLGGEVVDSLVVD